MFRNDLRRTIPNPKAKGILAEDHPHLGGVCAGVAGDAVLLEFFARADLLVGLGFDPVESDKLWHQTMRMVSIGPLTIAAGDFAPEFELVGDVGVSIEALLETPIGPFAWAPDDLPELREGLARVLRPSGRPDSGLSPFEVTQLLRDRCPRDTFRTTDVGSVKFVVSQAWTTWEPLTFLESHGLSLR